MISRNGICYDFSVSDYRHTVDGITYVFSSELHKEKFAKRLSDNRKTISKSLSKRFGFDITVTKLADIVLYKKIETRGFLIVTNEGKEICQNNNLKLDGEILTLKTCQEQ